MVRRSLINAYHVLSGPLILAAYFLGRTPLMKAKIGIIGGSGIDELEELRGAQWKSVPSPFGNTSDKLLFGEINSVPIVFLPRHGRGHKLPPTAINYRANIEALTR